MNKSDEPTDFFRLLLQKLGVPEFIHKIGHESFPAIIVIVLAVWLSGISAFVVGIIISLPISVSKIMSAQSVAHLGAQITFMAAVGWIIFRIVRPILLGVYSIYLVAVTKFCITQKKPRGYRDPVVARWQRCKIVKCTIKNNTLIISSQTGLALISVAALFLYPEQEGNQNLIPWRVINFAFFLAVMSIFAFLSAHQVPSKTSHWGAVKSKEGLPLFVSLILLLLVYVGILYSVALSGSQPFHLQTTYGSCRLNPMFPVSGGQLFFDQLSSGYLLIGREGSLFALPGGSSTVIADCAANSEG